MNKTLVKFIIPAICLIVTSCSSMKKISVTVRQAPEIKIPGTLPVVGIVNTVASEPSSQVYVESELLYTGASRDGSNAICDAILKTMGKSGQFSMLTVKYSGEDLNEHREPFALTIEEAEKLRDELKCDALFVVEYFFADLSRDVNELTETGPEGKPVFVATMTGRVEASLNVFIKDANGQLVALKPAIYEQNVDISANGPSRSDAKSNLGSSRTIVTNWGSDLGYREAVRYIGQEFSVKRDFFVGKQPEFKDALTLLKAGNPAEAFNEVRKCTNSDSKEIRDRAWYNMAVIAEASGDRVAAMQFVEKSDAKEAYSYRSLLNSLID